MKKEIAEYSKIVSDYGSERIYINCLFLSSGIFPMDTKQSVYTATKAGVIGFSQGSWVCRIN